jgi:hypothetical protein
VQQLQARAVPFLKSWSGWEPMWEWFTKVRMFHACIRYSFLHSVDFCEPCLLAAKCLSRTTT